MMMNALASAKSVNVRKLGYMTKISNPLHYHHFPFILNSCTVVDGCFENKRGKKWSDFGTIVPCEDQSYIPTPKEEYRK